MGQQLERPACTALWCFTTTYRHQLGFAPTVKFRRSRRRGPNLTIQRGCFTLQHETTANTIDGVHVHAQHTADFCPYHAPVRSIVIAQQEHLGMPDLANRGMTMTSELFQTLTLLRR